LATHLGPIHAQSIPPSLLFPSQKQDGILYQSSGENGSLETAGTDPAPSGGGAILLFHRGNVFGILRQGKLFFLFSKLLLCGLKSLKLKISTPLKRLKGSKLF
jgi:hypothetical protein